MEREQKKKNLVVYNLPESKKEEARERYLEDEEACRIIFEEGIEQVEQKQLIRLGKREENKIRPVLVKLGEKETGREILMKAKRLTKLRAVLQSIYRKRPK